MRVSEKQLLIMFETLKESCTIVDNARTFSLSDDDRWQLVKDIINQQSYKLLEIRDK